eukprot:TRINITY_DN3708_c0_g1_i1.p1 TRINITY_DN3708_c0_g1~~TRINITY_DN3708_c0_g1_i1.p1  ORF type:complete len:1235 (+),score=206.04 TRINITY_DN3708_c0_g1_i1:98-3802(+)
MSQQIFLYSLTLQSATVITHAIAGFFSNNKAQEILIARGKILELLRQNETTGRLHTVLSMEIFGNIRSLQPFRLTGDKKDYIVVGSDSGRIVVLQYNDEKNTFDKVHVETFGRSGCRRIVPGQYLAADPNGRAIMISAIEKQKMVYILNRDAAARLTISSPLEAHKASTIIFSITGVDVGFDNPIFAAIELSYQDADHDPTGQAAQNAQKHLTYYELDLGLNHVVRKWSEPIDSGANKLVTVPGGSEGPGGVLICCENFVVWKNQGHSEVRAAIPRRRDVPKDKSVLITSVASHKQKDLFFFLLQTEYGDLIKCSLAYQGTRVSAVKLQYFDTVPPANAMVVLKTGYLFIASEFSNQMLYQFQSIEDDEMETGADGDEVVYMDTHPLQKLSAVFEMESLAPIIDAKILDLQREDVKQIYALCGQGPRSSLRILRHGLTTTEMAVSPLPGNPNGVWTVKRHKSEPFDKYIIVSFVNATLVLSIGATVEEVTDSGFYSNTTTLNVGLVGDDSLVQIYAQGIRFIRSDKRITEWPAPSKSVIVHSAINRRQVVIAMSGGELRYFELDVSGMLVEVGRKDTGGDISCLDVAPIPKGRQRARFLAVGDHDSTIRILSLDHDDLFQPLAVQSVAAPPESLCIVKMRGQSGGDPSATSLFLNIGLQTGILVRAALDRLSGELSDLRNRFLGTRPVRLFKVRVQEKPAMLAVSSRSWLCYNYQTRFLLTPLSYTPLEFATNFASPQCPEGIVATAQGTLRVLTPEKLGEVFNQDEIKLRYTPRKMIEHPTTRYLIIIETDQNTPSATIPGSLRSKLLEAQQLPITQVKTEETESAAPPAVGAGAPAQGFKLKGREEMVQELDALQREQAAREEHARSFGWAKPGHSKWASCLRLFDVTSKETIDILELENNEAAFSMCTCTFHDRAGEIFLIVGTVKDLQMLPTPSWSSGFIHVYRMLDNGKRFSLLHKTPVPEGLPGALCQFQGRLLVGVGKTLRIYDLGKKRLLRKCENKNFAFNIRYLHTINDRIIAGDLAESFHFAKYRRSENAIFLFADDTTPRWLTACHPLDYDTMAGGDKFGNLFVCRVPQEVSEEVDDSPSGSILPNKNVTGAPYKVASVNNFHVGEIVTSLQKARFTAAGNEAVIYTTIMGAVGALLPFSSREDVDFFSHLEMHMRSELPPLCGRDHLAFRSAYYPVKDCIDGDLCEQYPLLPPEKQQAIATELDRTPSEVLKKLEIIRNTLL